MNDLSVLKTGCDADCLHQSKTFATWSKEKEKVKGIFFGALFILFHGAGKEKRFLDCSLRGWALNSIIDTSSMWG